MSEAPDYPGLRQTAIAAAEAGAEVLCHYFEAIRNGTSSLRIEEKARNDLVSRADRESEELIVERIQRDFPDHSFLAEEGGTRGPESELQWIIDPLDGTANFLQGLPIWSISIACRHRGELVLGVVLEPLGGSLFSAALGEEATWNDRPLTVSNNPDPARAFLATGFPFRAHPALDLFLAVFRDVFMEVRAIRRCGSAALDLAHVAAGIYDGFFEFRLSTWDVAAGAFLVRQAGGLVTDLDGGEGFLRSGNIVAGTPVLQPRLLEWVRRHADEAMLDRLVPLD